MIEFMTPEEFESLVRPVIEEVNCTREELRQAGLFRGTLDSFLGKMKMAYETDPSAFCPLGLVLVARQQRGGRKGMRGPIDMVLFNVSAVPYKVLVSKSVTCFDMTIPSVTYQCTDGPLKLKDKRLLDFEFDEETEVVLETPHNTAMCFPRSISTCQINHKEFREGPVHVSLELTVNGRRSSLDAYRLLPD